MIRADRIMELLGEAKKLAQEYRSLTGKPLGITGEVAEYEAARLVHRIPSGRLTSSVRVFSRRTNDRSNQDRPTLRRTKR